MDSTEVGGIVRTLAATLSGMLAANGLVTADQSQALAGGLAAVAVAVWSWWQKKKAKQALNAAKDGK